MRKSHLINYCCAIFLETAQINDRCRSFLNQCYGSYFFLKIGPLEVFSHRVENLQDGHGGKTKKDHIT